MLSSFVLGEIEVILSMECGTHLEHECVKKIIFHWTVTQILISHAFTFDGKTVESKELIWYPDNMRLALCFSFTDTTNVRIPLNQNSWWFGQICGESEVLSHCNIRMTELLTLRESSMNHNNLEQLNLYLIQEFMAVSWLFCDVSQEIEPWIATNGQNCERIEYKVFIELTNHSQIKHDAATIFRIQDQIIGQKIQSSFPESNMNQLRTSWTIYVFTGRPIFQFAGLVAPVK